MNILSGYRHNEALRRSFNALAEQTFGLSFENWYKNGFWGEDYNPHSIVIDGQVVANVSVNRTDLLFGGQRRRILQLGTVMTMPEFRGQGLSRAILDYILEAYADADGIYLFANDSVVDFYPKFGFRPGSEWQYTRPVSLTGARTARQVIMDTPESWNRLRAAMETSTFPCGCAMVDNPGLIFFYVSQFMTDAVWHIPHLDAWVIAEPEEGRLTIHNIFAPGAVSIEEVARAFGTVEEIALGFAPADKDGWSCTELQEEDTHFFVRGRVFEEFEDLRLRIPSLSHA